LLKVWPFGKVRERPSARLANGYKERDGGGGEGNDDARP
jgi:hypothetical protein